MKAIFEEMGEMIIGVVAAVAITAMVMGSLADNGILHNIVLDFIHSIC